MTAWLLPLIPAFLQIFCNLTHFSPTILSIFLLAFSNLFLLPLLLFLIFHLPFPLSAQITSVLFLAVFICSKLIQAMFMLPINNCSYVKLFHFS